MTRQNNGLDDVLAYLAATLFGREECSGAPEKGYYCLSAVDAGYESQSAGPWYRYSPDSGWSCGLCISDPYLNEHADKYLLNGNGMLEIIEAMCAKGYEVMIEQQTAHQPEEISPGVFVEFVQMTQSNTSRHDMDAGKMPETVARAAYAALQESGN